MESYCFINLDILLKASEKYLVYTFVYALLRSGFLAIKYWSSSAAEKEISFRSSSLYCNTLTLLYMEYFLGIFTPYFICTPTPWYLLNDKLYEGGTWPASTLNLVVDSDVMKSCWRYYFLMKSSNFEWLKVFRQFFSFLGSVQKSNFFNQFFIRKPETYSK